MKTIFIHVIILCNVLVAYSQTTTVTITTGTDWTDATSLDLTGPIKLSESLKTITV